MKNIDKIHGAVVETKITETAWVFIHADGYKEVVLKDDMEEQPIQTL